MKAIILLGMISLTGCGDKEEELVQTENELETTQVIEEQTDQATERQEETTSEEKETTSDEDAAFNMFSDDKMIKAINKMSVNSGNDNVVIEVFETTETTETTK